MKQLEGHIYGVHLKDIVKFDDVHAEDTVVSKGVIDFPDIQGIEKAKFQWHVIHRT